MQRIMKPGLAPGFIFSVTTHSGILRSEASRVEF